MIAAAEKILPNPIEYRRGPHVIPVMKMRTMIPRWTTLALLLIITGSSISCMTTYDSAGRPIQSVDPGLAVAGVAAAGLIGYAIANDHDNHYYHGGHGGHGGHSGYYEPYCHY
jgi:hypothetical protein